MHYSKINKLSGHLSSAHNGNVLEAINLAINAFEHHYVDRDLQRTGLSVVFITAGTCQFHVDKSLLRLTTERMIDLGVTVDCVSLAKMPLHQVPLFRFSSADPLLANQVVAPSRSEPDSRSDTIHTSSATSNPRRRKAPPESFEPLYYETGEDGPQEESIFYIVPAWVDSSFYSRQPDKPFRVDRFMPRCNMPQIQRLGVAEHENATFSIPFLRDELKLTEAEDRKWAHLSDKEKRQLARERYGELAAGNKNPGIKGRRKGVPSKDGSALVPPVSDKASDHGNNLDETPIEIERQLRKQPSVISATTQVSGRSSRLFSVQKGIPTSAFRIPSLATSAMSSASSAHAVSSPSKVPFTPALLSRIAAQADEQQRKERQSKGWFWSLRAGARKDDADTGRSSATLKIDASSAGSSSTLEQPNFNTPQPSSPTGSSSLSLLKPTEEFSPSQSPVFNSPIIQPTESDQTVPSLDLKSAAAGNHRISQASTLISSHLTESISCSNSPDPPIPDYRRFNPSNPKRNRDLLLGQMKRWQNVFSRRAADQRSVKWRCVRLPESFRDFLADNTDQIDLSVLLRACPSIPTTILL
jgi:hypothetical protein